MKLTPENVQSILFDCLFTNEEVKDLAPGETPPDMLTVEGITATFGLNKDRLDKHKEEIKEFLSQIPDEFVQDKGGGMSFLQLPFLKDGTQWGEHKSAHELMLLGIASKFMNYCAPRELWESLPGGVPYLMINLEGL